MAAVQLTEEAAATRIQARYRGHAVRTHRVAVDKVVDNATNDEKTVVGEERESQQEPVTEEQRTRQAATRIQAGVRGHITRKNLRQQRQKQEEEEEAERYRKDAAATKLQAGFRGSQVRRQRRDDNQRKQLGKEKHDEQPGEGAAKEAQRKERDDEKGREKDDAVSKKTSIEKSEKAAVKIQAGYRGFKGRQLVKEKRSAMDNTEKAAVKIQAGFRGYKGRRQAKEERVIRKFTFPKTHGTIVEGANFRPAQEATSLQKFLYSKKPNINGLTGLLSTRNNAQRQTMKDNYQSRFLKDLLEEARSAELSGNFQELAIALLMQTADYDAHCISEAVSGIGTNAAMLTEVMCTQEAADIHNLTQQYKSKHNQKLESVFRSETTGDFQKLMMAICKGVRAADVTVNVADARRDAEMLAKAMHGSKSLKLINFFAKSSFSHIKETQEQYRQIFARPLRDDLKKLKRSQLLQNAFLTTAAYADHPVLYYSEKLHESINNDTMLIRLVVARCEVDLVEIKEAYKEMHHMSLDDAIESKSFNEDYKKLLLAITRGNIDPTTNENPAKQSETDVASRETKRAKSATKEAKNGKKTSKKDTAAVPREPREPLTNGKE
ncbi:PREDICTED: annexin-B12-like [Priapulus caudatus]|uniref:Annexin-B12-like n=1 Tax=Priapulus caudatus TaxID=37621 RepID=A0ABM1F5B4_PRICU|nr:PREDICTED: annexin-B12-like [Priapulus caudatus]